MATPIAIVRNTGAAISFQDHGRVGTNSWLNYGVSPAGSLDPFAADAANTLVHNLASDTVLEIMLGGCELEILSDCWLGHVGGCACKSLPIWSARHIKAGEILRFNPSPAGVWSYLAIAGGWQATSHFGSTSRHERSDLGSPITQGLTLFSDQTQPSSHPSLGSHWIPVADQRDYLSPPPLRLTHGPHRSLFSEEQFKKLTESIWTLSSRSDRTGYRLTGDSSSSLAHNHSIHSTPTLVGSVQIPPSGEPIVTLNDGPTVGGYPIIARLHPDDISWLVQQHAHQPVRFTLETNF